MMSSSNPFLDAMLALRKRSDWNERLRHWEKPASDTEEAQIERAAAMVREALGRRLWLVFEGVEVREQGSYHNNTNVRRESDMDLCAWHPAIKIEPESGLSREEVDRRLGYTNLVRGVLDIARDLRTQVGEALIAEFGAHNVTPGNKAFRVSGIPGSRAAADVVPALRFDYVFKRNLGLLGDELVAVEGIVIHAADGTQAFNFPRQHHENGKAKRERTARRFKKVVRMLKHLRDELVDSGVLPDGSAPPSFLVECLVYRVEDPHFVVEEDRYDRLRRVLRRIWALLSDDAWVRTALEINDVKLLFHGSQPWQIGQAKAFVALALQRLEM